MLLSWLLSDTWLMSVPARVADVSGDSDHPVAGVAVVPQQTRRTSAERCLSPA